MCPITARSPVRAPPEVISSAAIAQLGERQTEDLKVPGSIPGLGILNLVCVGLAAHLAADLGAPGCAWVTLAVWMSLCVSECTEYPWRLLGFHGWPWVL